MSLYNLLHGANPDSTVLLAVLDLDSGSAPKYPTGRFRDIHLDEKGEKIILYTRNGGGNREDYQYVFDALQKHPNYLTDYDDDFDCTYAYIEFSVPDPAKALCKSLATGEKPKKIYEKLQQALAEMERMTPEQFKKDPRFAPIVTMLENVVKGDA